MDAHKQEAAALLAQADLDTTTTLPPTRGELISEALVHAVLHLAEVMDHRRAYAELHGR